MRTVRAVAVMAALGFLALPYSTYAEPDRPPAYATPIFDLPAGNLVGCGVCGQSNCPPEAHWYGTYVEGPDRDMEESSHVCPAEGENGWCKDAHPESTICIEEGGGGGGDLSFRTLDNAQKQHLWTTAVKASPSALSKLVAEYGDRVSYNAERKALQVRACSGVIVLSIPLGSRQVQALTE